MSSSQAAQWIWAPSPGGPAENLHLDFRETFDCPSATSSVTIRIAAFHDFLLRLDGVEIGRGQYSDYPDDVTATTFDLPAGLSAGRHVVSVLAWYAGRDFSTRRTGTPGLWCEIRAAARLVVATGTGWRCRPDPAWTSGPIAVVTPQLGFTTCRDARLEDGWEAAGYDDSAWPRAVPSSGRAEPMERPVPPLVREEAPPPRIVALGTLTRTASGEPRPVAAEVAADSLRPFPGPPRRLDSPLSLGLPAAPANGLYVILDCGGERTGSLEVELEAAAGTVVDIAHGEHLLDGRVRCHIGGRCFADRLICREGTNRHTLPFRRIGARYLELHLTRLARPVLLRGATIVPTMVPLPPPAVWDDGEAFAARLRALSVKTLRCCMHEHYEDCPWREQALYGYDSRNQALFGYYLWGNDPFAAASFDLLGRGIRPDGLLELCAPARVPVTIPAFSFVWITAVRDHFLYSGDDRLFRRFEGQIEEMLDRAWMRRDGATGLPRPPGGAAIWDFFEWQPMLDGNQSRSADHVLYGLYLAMALRAWEELRARAGRPVAIRSRPLLEAIGRRFRRGDGFLGTLLEDGRLSGCHEHVNALALKLGLLSPSLNPEYVRRVVAKELTPVTTSVLSHALDALAMAGGKGMEAAEDRLGEEFDAMVASGHDTLWETRLGASDFDGAGSLCHGWSAVGVYWQGARRLGVRPLEPGFRRFEVSPWLGARARMAGEVPTPSGPIRIACRRRADGLELEVRHPDDLEAVVTPRSGEPVAALSVMTEASRRR